MPGLSKVIVLDPDARACRQVQLGFEREGVPTAAAATAAELEVPGDEPGLVVVGGVDGHGVELVRRARGWLDGRGIDAPLVFAGRGAEPRDATAAGADEVVRHPAYLRDVVTIGRLLRGRPADQRDRIVGNLIELTGVFTLVRALSALGRSATLTLIRGLRRGEVRFYFGEVTSAQVGLIHGQAALHQLLLWTDARFDFHHVDVVRRHQIPLSRDELFADAERFLEGVRDSSGGLSPAMVLEQDLPRVQSLAKQIPTEVYGVLRMFDGHRALADVLEDSAYRVFETLRVAQRAVEAGLIRVIDRPPPRPGFRTILAIEDWLVGGEPRDAVAGSDATEAASDPAHDAVKAVNVAVNDARPATIRDARGAPAPARASAQGAGQGAGKTARKRRKKKRRADTPPATAIHAAGLPEIDWGALVPRTVGAEVGPLAGVVPASHVSGEIVTTARRSSGSVAASAEPTIVFDEAADRAEADRAAAERAAAEARDRAEAERAEAERVAAERAEAERAAAERATAEARVRAEAERVAAERAEAEAHARAEAERAGIKRAEAEVELVAAMALAQAEAERIAAERAAAKAHARTKAEARADARADDRAEADLAEADRAAAETERATAGAHDRAEAGRAEVDRAEAERAAAERTAAERTADAEAEARANAIRAVAATVSVSSEPARVIEDLELADTRPERPGAVDKPGLAATAAGSPPAADPVTSDAVVEDVPGAVASDAITAPMAVVSPPDDAAAPDAAAPAPARADESTPTAVVDEPSDGVVRHHIATAETAPVKRRQLPHDPRDDDRPGETTGEITMPRPQPQVVIRYSEPTILVPDLAAIQAEVGEFGPAGSASHPAAGGEPHGGPAFSDAEEAFFRAGQDKAAAHHEAESFDDLDEGYRPVGFWERLTGRGKPGKPDRTGRPSKKPKPDR